MPLSSAGGLPPLQRSVSASRQFIVYGTDATVRATLCGVAERTKASLLALLQRTDGWQTPIIINAQHPQANLPENPVAALNFSQTGFGLKFQLDLTITADADVSAIERELLRVVLLEIMYREQPALPVGTQYVQPPDWLLEGLLACADLREPVALSALLKIVVADNRAAALEEFIRQQAELLDSPSRAVYRAYSFVLVRRLIDWPNGRELLAKFIADLPQASNNAAADLIAHFPVLGGSLENAEKEWRSTVTRVASLESYEPLTFAETERRLDDLLRLRFSVADPDQKIWSLEDYARLVRLPHKSEVLNQLNQNLMLLATRANPVYRPIIFEYEQVVMRLARGKTHGISSRLARLKNSRQSLELRIRMIDDYMNWFEATQAETRSGIFAEYLKAAAKTQEAGWRRRDAISVYLDSLESQFRD